MLDEEKDLDPGIRRLSQDTFTAEVIKSPVDVFLLYYGTCDFHRYQILLLY
jgi:hypothetical protein